LEGDGFRRFPGTIFGSAAGTTVALVSGSAPAGKVARGVEVGTELDGVLLPVVNGTGWKLVEAAVTPQSEA
jgi:hypothetical protein